MTLIIISKGLKFWRNENAIPVFCLNSIIGKPLIKIILFININFAAWSTKINNGIRNNILSKILSFFGKFLNPLQSSVNTV